MSVGMDILSINGNYTDRLKLAKLAKGVINFNTAIDETVSGEVMDELDAAINHFGNKSITLEITSPGGDVYESIAIYDAIMSYRKMGVVVTGHVFGIAASAAAMVVLQACDKRIATKNSRLLLHEVSRTAFGSEKKSEAEDELKETKILHEWILDVLVLRTNKPREVLSKQINRREFWMSAQEAKDFGLIDEVV